MIFKSPTRLWSTRGRVKLLVMALCLASAIGYSQSPPLQVVNSSDPVSSGPAKINFNDSYLYTNKAGRFTGSGAPGSIAFSVAGDLYFDVVGGNAYWCASTLCSVSPTWKLFGSGSGGTVSWTGLTNAQWTGLTNTQWTTMTN